MDEEQLKKRYLLRDRVVRVLSKDGHFRVSCIKNSNSVRLAQTRHGLDVLPAYLLARTMTSASLMSSFLKGEERIIIEAEGNGPINKVFAEAMQVGEIRGYVGFAENGTKYEINDVSEALGVGVLKIGKILYNRSEPLTGIVPLQKGDIAADLAYYFSQSEQIHSAVILDSDFEEDGLLKYSGGILLQAMPGAPDKKIEEVYENLQKMPKLREYFAEEYNPLGILKKVLPFEFDVLKSSPVDFLCRCSKESFTEKLLTLGEDEIRDMQKQDNRELVCQFCNEHYHLEDDDFDKLIQELSAKKN